MELVHTHVLHILNVTRILTYGLETPYLCHVFMLCADHEILAQQFPAFFQEQNRSSLEHLRAQPPTVHVT